MMDWFRRHKHEWASPAEEARFRHSEGQEALAKKNYRKAARELKRAIELSPGCVDAGRQLEETYFELALEKRLKTDQLVSLFQECAAANPDTVAYAVLGRIYDVLGMPDEANRQYERHLQIHPDWEQLPGLIDGRPLEGWRAVAVDEIVRRMLGLHRRDPVQEALYPTFRRWPEIRESLGR